MKHLLNTLYILSEDVYVALDGENVVVLRGEETVGRLPLHTLEGILCFSYKGASPALMGACAERGIGLSFFTPRGRFLARVQGMAKGNVLLRKRQYRVSEDEGAALSIARNFIVGKIFNSKWVLERALRDHAMRIDEARVKRASEALDASLRAARECAGIDSLRGIEGDAAATYYGAFDELLLRDKEFFRFAGRSRRPPMDAVNAMLSLFYTVLANDCAAALEGVGLDSYIGFMHVDRPGRKSLALDLEEELRPICVDRFVVSAVNNRVVSASSFETRETGEVRLTEEGRRALFENWQNRKKEQLVHPFLKTKVPRGLVPHVQALLLARFLRGDLDGYPPFLWK